MVSCGSLPTGFSHKICFRSEEHTSELQSHSDLHSFPTRRSSDLIAVEKATMIMGHPSQFAIGDELPGILDERSPAIVVANESQHSGRVGGSGTLDGFLRIPANRFLT